MFEYINIMNNIENEELLELIDEYDTLSIEKRLIIEIIDVKETEYFFRNIFIVLLCFNVFMRVLSPNVMPFVYLCLSVIGIYRFILSRKCIRLCANEFGLEALSVDELKKLVKKNNKKLRRLKKLIKQLEDGEQYYENESSSIDCIQVVAKKLSDCENLPVNKEIEEECIEHNSEKQLVQYLSQEVSHSLFHEEWDKFVNESIDYRNINIKENGVDEEQVKTMTKKLSNRNFR